MHVRNLGALALCLAAAGCQNRQEDIEKNFGVYTGTDKVFVQVNDQAGYASASGIWTIEGDDKIADPINITDIFCTKSDSYCEEHRAWVTSIVERPQLMAAREIYNVTSWGPDKVVAISHGECRSIELTISKPDQSVIAVVRSTGTCSGRVPKLDAPRYQRLISGKQLDEMRKT